ncbi:MAG: tetratricopeptide repeat protein, partial [Pirellulaceae bacterium]
MTVSQSEIDRWLAEGDAFRQEGKLAHAATAYERAVSASERPGAAVCLKLARCYEQSGALDDARRWAIAVVDQGDDFAAWQTAAGILRRSSSSRPAQGRRTIRVAITGSYHTQSFAQLLPLASAARGIEIEVWEGAFGQYRQEILDPES